MLQMEGTKLQGQLIAFGRTVFGLVRGEEGWNFLVNGSTYPLAGRKWDFELLLGRNGGLFTFYWEREAVCAFRFESERDSILKLYETLLRV